MDLVNSKALVKLKDFTDKFTNGGKEVLKTLKIDLKDTKYKPEDGWTKRSYSQETQA